MNAVGQRWAIINAQLVDGDVGRPPAPGGLLIDGNRIVASGSDVTAASVGGVAIRDVGGQTVLPGLIDVHVHATWDASARPVDHLVADMKDLGALLESTRARLAAVARRGTTTVRDLGGAAEVMCRLRDDATSHLPRVFAAGRVITTPRGHCNFVGRHAWDVGSAERAVEDEVEAGVDWIKVMVNGGVHTPESDPTVLQFSTPILRAIVVRSHRLGRPVTAHATSPEAIRCSIEAGVDSIQHGGLLSPADAKSMAAGGIALTPTLGTTHALAAHKDDLEIPAPIRERGLRLRSSGSRQMGLAIALEAGVSIVAGTDSGTTHVAHGDLATELELLVAQGLTPAAAISAATTAAAHELRLDGEIGTLQPGAIADLLILDDDPTVEIHALRRPAAVYLGGRSVPGAAG